MRSILPITDNIVVAAKLASAAFSQGPPRTIATLVVAPKALAVGYRATPMVGSPVPNDAGEAAGRIDDLIVAAGRKGAAVGGDRDRLRVEPGAMQGVADDRLWS